MKRILTMPLGLAAIALAAATLLFAPSAYAHAAVTSVAWDNSGNPTRVIGKTSDLISSAPGDFAFKLVNASGIQVDNGDARVSPSFTELSVGVPGSLPNGAYKVEWSVTSADGHRESGSNTIQLMKAAAAGATAPAMAMPAAGHAATVAVDDHADDDHDQPYVPTEPSTIELDLTGAQEVPAVKSAASAFARITVNPTTKELSYAITLSGVAPGAVTGLHVHRGGPTENGPHVFDIINAPFSTISGKTTLSDSAINDLYAGNLYLRLHTVDFPAGAARAQIVVPAPHDGDHDHAPVSTPSTVRPPSTGDAGLVSSETGSSVPVLAAGLLTATLVALAGFGVLSARRI